MRDGTPAKPVRIALGREFTERDRVSVKVDSAVGLIFDFVEVVASDGRARMGQRHRDRLLPVLRKP